MRVFVAGVLALVITTAGCFGVAPEELDGPTEAVVFVEPEQRINLEARSFRADVHGELPGFTGAWVYIEETRMTEQWTFDVAAGSENLLIELRWAVQDENDFQLVVEHPDGTDRFQEEEPQTVRAAYEVPADGTWTVYVTTEGLMRGADSVRIDASWVHIERPELPRVPVVEDKDGWFASVTIANTGLVPTPVNLDVSTFNGNIRVQPSEDEVAAVELRQWARAASDERAVQLVETMVLNHSLSAAGLSAHAEGDTSQDERSGVDIILRVPGSLEGHVNAMGGSIELLELVLDGELRLETVHGGVYADLRTRGDLSIVTRGGPVTLGLTPYWDTSLNLDSEGPVDLRLTQTNVTGYNLEVQPTEGEVMVDMQTVAYDDESGAIVTEGFDSTRIQVKGMLRSVGDITITGVSPEAEPGPPGAPANFTLQPRGVATFEDLGKTQMSWSPPEDDGGAPVVLYHVYRDGSLVATLDGTTSYTDDGEVTEAHHYHVTAQNMAGEGPATDTMCSPPGPMGVTESVTC